MLTKHYDRAAATSKDRKGAAVRSNTARQASDRRVRRMHLSIPWRPLTLPLLLSVTIIELLRQEFIEAE